MDEVLQKWTTEVQTTELCWLLSGTHASKCLANSRKAVIQSPHLHTNIHQIEMIQKKAARFVFSDYFRYSSVTAMLNELDWQSLERRRDDSILVMFHKIINQYVDIPYDHILCKVPSITRSSSRKFLHLPSRIDSFMHSFFPRAIRLWNHLPDHFVETNNVDTFKTLLAT